MAMNTERSAKAAAMHNFTMPCDLRWGNQRFLRCMRVSSDGRISPLHRSEKTTVASHRHHSSSKHHRLISVGEESSFDGSLRVGSIQPPFVDQGIAAVREKVMFDLQTAADKMKDAIFKKGLVDGEVPGDATPRDESQTPWSLRTRRAISCKTTPFGASSTSKTGGITGTERAGGNKLTTDYRKPSSGFPQTKTPTDDEPPSTIISKLQEREKFSVPLSKRAIEEDFFTFANHRPPRRPKKRPKMVQKYLDTLFPGLWLTEVTPNMYKVTESAP